MGGRHPKKEIDVGHGRVDGDPGGGPVDAATGLREWYNPDPETPGITWADIFDRWTAVEADLHQSYGVDLGQPGLLKQRTGHWLRVRVIGLLADPKTRLFRMFQARDEQPAVPGRDDISFDDFE